LPATQKRHGLSTPTVMPMRGPDAISPNWIRRSSM
jgi:hypothetical protein